jgi:Family of unknown function (DUF6152)
MNSHCDGSARLRLSMNKCRISVGVAALLFALQALSHHSGAMFDNQTSLTLTGTVKAFQWTNPHCWIQVLVPGEQGPSEWSVEMGSPAQLYRGGWKQATVKPGDKITIVIHPMRDGTQGGLFVSAVGKDGKPIANAVSGR